MSNVRYILSNFVKGEDFLTLIKNRIVDLYISYEDEKRAKD